MLALFLIPALLGLALVIDIFDDDDENVPDPVEPTPQQVPDDEPFYRGTSEDDIIQARSQGGVHCRDGRE